MTIAASWLDYAIIAFYFLGILWVGTLFGKYTKSTKDFFFGGQRFSWWLVAISSIATVVGSYSFIKYAAIGYRHGLSSTMTYLNDWFIIPFFLLGWLPIIYFNRIQSIPEYFTKRFDRRTGMATVAIILVFLTGYVGINFYTLGVAMQPLIGVNLYIIVVVVAIVGAIYMHAGGQTSVIMTDLLQGIVLLVAGLLLFALGIAYIGGFREFLSGLSLEERLPFTQFNRPTDFSHVGIFWQDAAASSVAFYFMNQGTIMRFLSARSQREGRRAIFAIVLIFMPLAVLAIANTGWLGRSMVNLGLIDVAALESQLVASGAIDPGEGLEKHIFVIVANLVAVPGVFGFVLAALTAALMSTIDTLINAVTAIFINDIYRPFLKPDRDEAHYLSAARITAIAATVIGVALVPFFAQFRSIYAAHGMFTATITPPVITLILMSIFWKRVTPKAAFWTLIGGSFLTLLGSVLAGSFDWPWLIYPFAHGIDPAGGYNYIRALYGIVVSLAILVSVSLVTRARPESEFAGLTIHSLEHARRQFKGGEPNDHAIGEVIEVDFQTQPGLDSVVVSAADMTRMKANDGDILYLADHRWWLGGLRSLHIKASVGDVSEGHVLISPEALEESHVDAGRRLKLEKLI
ncbi:MAG: sodium/solute symporter [Spirochaetales bacterium]|nr:sodium/solute symporter [Leptospiraceae bacterium]MCP5482373.1 sodium/solute symporter [Spirochaetales bacterium]MCP5484188.1 sodium/solute symporter [Spirochaetales bacterium]